MPKRFPPGFRRDVIAVARRREGTLSLVAHNFGISPSCLQRWLAITDREEGITVPAAAGLDGAVPSDAEAHELRRRNKLLEQENEVMHHATVYFARDALPK